MFNIYETLASLKLCSMIEMLLRIVAHVTIGNRVLWGAGYPIQSGAEQVVPPPSFDQKSHECIEIGFETIQRFSPIKMSETVVQAGLLSGNVSPALAVDAKCQINSQRTIQPVIWMSADTPVSSVNSPPGSSAKAVFSEVRMRLEQLLAQDKTYTIDLRFMKSMPDERARLAELLGRGEVSAEVNSVGRSEVLETALPCVWLVRHFNSEAELVSELLEITDFPEILASDRQAVAHCLKVLSAGAVPGIN